jgi:hypothetical protein
MLLLVNVITDCVELMEDVGLDTVLVVVVDSAATLVSVVPAELVELVVVSEELDDPVLCATVVTTWVPFTVKVETIGGCGVGV